MSNHLNGGHLTFNDTYSRFQELLCKQLTYGNRLFCLRKTCIFIILDVTLLNSKMTDSNLVLSQLMLSHLKISAKFVTIGHKNLQNYNNRISYNHGLSEKSESSFFIECSKINRAHDCPVLWYIINIQPATPRKAHI